MFFYEKHDNVILACTRCGHTTLSSVLGHNPRILFENFIVAPRRIVVLRNPIQRMHSAYYMYQKWEVIIEHLTTHNLQKNIIQFPYIIPYLSKTKEERRLLYKEFYQSHCEFYMHKIEDLEFDILPFEFFGNYFSDTYGLPSHSTSLEIKDHLFDDVITREGLSRELEYYEKYRQKNIISPEEFKSLFLVD